MLELKCISSLHGNRARRFGAFIAVCVLSASVGCGNEGEGGPLRPEPVLFDEALWREPPRACHPYVRWWWPGGAVETGKLREEIQLLHEVGFGGLEIQTLLFGLSPAEVANNPAIRTVGSETFLGNLRTVLDEAERLDVAVDLTLGSGWPNGGPFISRGSERQLLMSSIDVSGPRLYEGPIPPPRESNSLKLARFVFGDAVGPFDKDARLVAAVAARIEEASDSPISLTSFTDITTGVSDGSMRWEVPDGEWKIFGLYENRTNQRVIGAAYPGSVADTLVLDHLDDSGVEELIEGLGDPWIEALGDRFAGAVFVDSFELMGELPWTSGFRSRFQEMKGYDITPYLPLVFLKGGEVKYLEMFIPEPNPVYVSAEVGTRVREDYDDVRAEAFEGSFIKPLSNWARERGISLRLQAHGGYGDYLDAYEIADIPESEGLFAGGSYDFLKLASSAGHTGGHTIISSESFIGMSLSPRSLSLEDFHLLAGRAFSAGITRIIHHGHPYGYVREDGHDWYPFNGFPDPGSISPLSFTSWIDTNHPVWPDLATFNLELARLSYALTRGTHRADLAWLCSEREFRDDLLQILLQVLGPQPEQGESDISLALKRAGFVYDRVSRKGLSGASVQSGGFAVGAARYEALLVTNLAVSSPELVESIERLARAGIPVLVLGTLPERATGLVDHERRDGAVREIVERLQSEVRSVSGVDGLDRELRATGLEPMLDPLGGEEFGFALDVREHKGARILFLFNESDNDRTQLLTLNSPARRVRMLYPRSGEIEEVSQFQSGIELTIQARRSRVLIVEE